jgi:DNA repair photolyase
MPPGPSRPPVRVAALRGRRDAPGPPLGVRGRGAAENPQSRFETLRYADDGTLEADPSLPPARVPTVLLRDPTRTLLAFNDSPDLPFDVSLNPYRGCEHGCAYCFARPTHEYLGFSAGLDFETKILVKPEAPALLRRALASASWKPRVVTLGAATDAYQPAERRLEITRRCLEVFAEFRNPVAIVTKSALVCRDSDLLAELARHGAAAVLVSVTTLDPGLHRRMEPRASAPARRLEAIAALAEAGVPVGAMLAPVIPAINDHEIPRIVEAVARSGAGFASHVMLRLPHGLKQLFEAWLERHFPERRQKVLAQVMQMRGGRLNDPHFHSRMSGSGVLAEQIHALFELACRRAGLGSRTPGLSVAAFRRPREPQLGLFDTEPR